MRVAGATVPPQRAAGGVAPEGEAIMRGSRRLTVGALVPVVLVLLLALACSSSNGAVGTYAHPEEGTIVLTSDHNGTWTQSSEPFSFTWSENGDAITFTHEGEDAAGVKIVDGNLVLPSDMISGDDPVTFTRQ